MRYFEFDEGSSPKFWEIALEDTGFTVRWGRLDTEGQTQRKSFPTAQKAQAQHDKLIAEKVQKGYAEVSLGTAATAPAAPGDIFWTAALKQRVLPRRGGVAVRVRAPLAPQKAWPLIREEHERQVNDSVNRRTRAAPLQDPILALGPRLKSEEPGIRTCEEDALLLAFLSYKRKFANWTPRTEPAIDLLFSLGGPVYATRTALLSLDIHLYGIPDPKLPSWSDEVFDFERNLFSHGWHWGLPRLRALLVNHTDDAGYRAARDAAAALRLTHEQRLASAFLFPTETAWVNAETIERPIREVWDYMLQVISDAVAVEHFRQKNKDRHFGRLIQSDDENEDYLPTLLDGVGRAILPLLRDYWSATTVSPRYIRRWVELVESIDSDEAMEELFSHVGYEQVRVALVDLLPRVPQRALRVLGPHLFGPTHVGEAAKDLLVHLLRVKPDVLRPAPPDLNPDVREALLRYAAPATPALPDAPPERLPPVLARPPWAADPPPQDLPEALLRFPARRHPVPESLGLQALPPPLLADGSARLPASAVEALATMLAFCPLEEPYAGLAQVKAACDPASLARFAWALFEAWQTLGGPTEEDWAFRALGLLGDETTASQLVPLIREWPGQGSPARAVTGVDILAAIGTARTLASLSTIAEKTRFKGLKEKAQQKLRQLAAAQGLLGEELADRLMPDLGLDPGGSLTLDYGARSFTVGFDEQLKPFVRDAQGAPLQELPKPGKADDKLKASAAAERWKVLKKDAQEAAGLQLLRLERAMCARRRWSAEVFRQLFVGHPLLIHGVRRLIWGIWSPEGTLQTTFRVTEDRTCADVNDDALTLPADARVGLPHPLELDASTIAAWRRLLTDYQFLQPFAQLERTTYVPSEAERESASITRARGLRVSLGQLLGLEARGWRLGPPQSGGETQWLARTTGPGREAHLDFYPGLSKKELHAAPEQELGGLMEGESYHSGVHHQRLLGELDAVLFSELVRDLESLRPA